MIGDRWGVSEAETRARYGCDVLVGPRPALAAWRGVDVAAPSDVVWRRLVQLRLAPYSYDWIDNLGRRSPRALHHLADPRVGEPFMACAGRPLGVVVAVEPGRELTGTLLGSHLSYRVEPVDAHRARLLMKIVMERPRWAAPALAVGDLVMARKQLLTLAALAEQDLRDAAA
ncbi:hypothetical protein K8Z61_14040 [Nocardioides sp. TRM66260-LWL]|uniref:hypothetical protein n=1 Tax=Nocardioides sp. TRM66260-LWL TaxID=2874478 RepID=UPI001CC3CED7|nr:hypothetical protein [Nocardioides sp. TRM66260-LWL]MBZ5735613.1 hypothetical protein [Nocardioides sp. TRM66260-LWL]